MFALEIYHFINPDSLTLEKGSTVERIPGETEKITPSFYLTFQGEGSFLSTVLSRINDPHEQNRIKMELAALCNKAMMAEPLDLFEIEQMKKVTQRVFHYLNLGLEYSSGEEESKAFEVLRSYQLQKIFQCGVGVTLLLRKKAESILKGPWLSGDVENLRFIDPPHRERFEGVLRKRPLLYRDGRVEDFKSLQDFREARNLLERGSALLWPGSHGRVMGNFFNSPPL